MSYDKILIVDDSSTARMIIHKCMDISGYSQSQFIEASDGLEALELLSKQEMDLVITDINMPKMDGVNFIKSIREKGIETSILVMTSVSDVITSEEQKRLNILGIIEKPLSPAKIFEILGEGEV